MHLCLCVVGFRVLLIRGPGRMEPVEGPPVSIVAGPGYNTFCGTTGVELDSRRDGHAIGQSGSTDPYSTVKIPVLFPLGTSLCI